MKRGDKPVDNQEEEYSAQRANHRKTQNWGFQEIGILVPKPEILPPERCVLWGPRGFSFFTVFLLKIKHC